MNWHQIVWQVVSSLIAGVVAADLDHAPQIGSRAGLNLAKVEISAK